ncbi:MAG: hypothetical protein AAF376_17780 [Pseudomonadota bacterium]
MRLDIRHNIRDVQRGLSDAARNQVPFATSVAINDVLMQIKRNTERRMRRVLHNPTPFTMRAFRVRRSTKRRLEGAVFAMDIQAQYLQWAETGGTRNPTGSANLVPVGQRVNQYGNLPRGAIKRVLARGNTFSGRPHDGAPGGIYQRIGGKRNPRLRLLVHYADQSRYQGGRLRFQRGALRTAQERMPVAFERALIRALSTAR